MFFGNKRKYSKRLLFINSNDVIIYLVNNPYYIGIDVGGTKISGAVVSDVGRLIVREKTAAPADASPAPIVATIAKLITSLLEEAEIPRSSLRGIGLGIPGIVDPQGHVVVTPNINLSGMFLSKALNKKFKVKICVGNDVNCGVLGEKWLGAARQANHVVGVFPGTGLGGGVIIDNQLLLGHKGAAAEIGHIIMDPEGPKCSCGNTGCLEAMTSRWAIERDIRQAVKNGKKTLLMKLCKGNLKIIKSGLLAQALRQKDPLVTTILKRASVILGQACINFRHIFDPELIIFGGGLIEACGDFMLPIITKTANADPFFSKIAL